MNMKNLKIIKKDDENNHYCFYAEGKIRNYLYNRRTGFYCARCGKKLLKTQIK